MNEKVSFKLSLETSIISKLFSDIYIETMALIIETFLKTREKFSEYFVCDIQEDSKLQMESCIFYKFGFQAQTKTDL